MEHEQLTLQRVRNRIMEYLEWVGSYDHQRSYQARVPIASVPDEAINQWEDYVQEDWQNYLIGPVFSDEEQAAIRAYNSVWLDVSDQEFAGSIFMPPLEQLIGDPNWERLRAAAEAATAVFAVRGKMPEDEEVVF
jgi:hypothetical protein